jgi:hypothetical protein
VGDLARGAASAADPVLYLRAIRRGTVGTVPPEVMEQEIDLSDEPT